MPPLTERLRHAVSHRVATVPRRIKGRMARSGSLLVEEVRLVSAVGYQIFGHIHRPADSRRPMPGVLLCPGIDDAGSVFDTYRTPVNAAEIARLGAVVLHFDPAGRGRSWGNEDYCGPEHQDNVQVALCHLLGRSDVVPSRSGVVAISLGIAMAVGALAAAGEKLPISWLIDWEGPCDREIITAGGRIMAPADGHGLDDEHYWQPREAVRHVGLLRCGYFRYQAGEDHAQPGELRHAQRMLAAARAGQVPWFQLNDHARGELPARPAWYPAGNLHANRVLLEKIRRFSGM